MTSTISSGGVRRQDPDPVSSPRRWLQPRGVGACVVIAVALVLPFTTTDHTLFQFATVLAMAVSVVSLNVILGFTGIISVGHGAIMGIGGYATVLVATKGGLHFSVGLVTAVVVCGLVGMVIGLPSLKIKGMYLALVTLGLALVFPAVVKRWEGLTGGAAGLYFEPPAAPFGQGLVAAQFVFLVCLTAFVVVSLAARRVTRDRSGRALKSVKLNELMAAESGISAGRVKITVFGLAAALAGLAGGLYQLVLGFALPDTYVLTLSLGVLTASVVGGSQSLVLGPLAGAAFVVLVPEQAAELGERGPQLTYAVGLLVVVYFFRGGIAQAPGRLWGAVKRRRNP